MSLHAFRFQRAQQPSLQALRVWLVVLLAVLSGCGDEPGSSCPSLSERCEPPSGAQPGTWSTTGSTIMRRLSHTATLLPNGKVLVAGGAQNDPADVTAEVYDPAAGTWSATGNLATGRVFHTATLLQNGKALAVGGRSALDNNSNSLVTAEVYDPGAGTWSATGSLATGRENHTATLLQNGKVLVVGGSGQGGSNALATAELYDPATGTWSATGSLTQGRDFHTATLLPNGKVLVAGGSYDDSNVSVTAEVYNPATGTWSATGNLALGRAGHAATALQNGKVLVMGGLNIGAGNAESVHPVVAELYDPGTGTWTSTGALSQGRTLHKATLLQNGKVLVTGGNLSGAVLKVAEVYDPGTGTWSKAGDPAKARIFHTATLLQNGKVLVAGGDLSVLSWSEELYTP